MLWDFNSLQSKFCCFSIKTFFSFLNKKAKKAKILRNEKKCRSSFCSYKVNIRHCPPKSSFVVSFMSHFAEKFLDFLLKTFPSERKNFAKDFFFLSLRKLLETEQKLWVALRLHFHTDWKHWDVPWKLINPSNKNDLLYSFSAII